MYVNIKPYFCQLVLYMTPHAKVCLGGRMQLQNQILWNYWRLEILPTSFQNVPHQHRNVHVTYEPMDNVVCVQFVLVHV
jgi:hypothetical protein